MSKRNLKGITWDHPRGLDCLVRCAEAYAESHEVEIRWSARSLKDFGDSPIDELAGIYDLLIVDHPHVGWAQLTGAFAPLDRFLSATQLETVRAQSTGPSHSSYDFGGHQWAVAVDAAMQAASYRPDLMDEPLPRTWADAVAFARGVRRRGRWMALPLAPTDAICLFISLCASEGDHPGRRDDGLFVSRVIGRNALQLLREISMLAVPESMGWNPIALLDAMARRDDIVYCPASFIYSNYARAGFRPNLVRFGNIPGTRGSCLGGAGIAVSAHSAHPRAAADFALWVGESAIQRTIYVAAHGQPGNIHAWHDVDANKLTNNFFTDTVATLESAYVRPRHAAWPAFQEEAGNYIHQWLRNGSSTNEEELLNTLEGLHRRPLRRSSPASV